MAARAYEYVQNLFSCFFGLATRGTHTPKAAAEAAAAAAAAAAEVALVVMRAATTPKTWPRSTPKTAETGDAPRGRLSADDPNRTFSSFFGPTDALLAACSFFCQFFRAGVVTSFKSNLFTYALLTTAR